MGKNVGKYELRVTNYEVVKVPARFGQHSYLADSVREILSAQQKFSRQQGRNSLRVSGNSLCPPGQMKANGKYELRVTNYEVVKFPARFGQHSYLADSVRLHHH